MAVTGTLVGLIGVIPLISSAGLLLSIMALLGTTRRTLVTIEAERPSADGEENALVL